MKMIVAVALALVAVAAALPVDDKVIQIVRSENQQNPEGGFLFAFETENGIDVQSQGQLKSVVNEENKPIDVVVFRGQYSYPDENGKLITVTYTADENGFHPEGDSIPKPVSRR